MTPLPDERQYDRVARYLDGEALELTDAERELAEEIQNGLAELESPLAPEVPPQSLRRAQRRLTAGQASQRRQRSLRRVGLVAGMAAAVVAFAFVVQSLYPPATTKHNAPIYVPTTVLRDAVEPEVDTFEVRMALLAEDIRQEQAQLADFAHTADADAFEGGMENLQKELETFWLDGQSDPDTPDFEALLIETGQG
jgi:hypothetical protein